MELEDIDAVRREGLQAAREIVADLVLNGEIIDGQEFDVTDESGAVVARIPYKAALRLD